MKIEEQREGGKRGRGIHRGGRRDEKRARRDRSPLVRESRGGGGGRLGCRREGRRARGSASLEYFEGRRGNVAFLASAFPPKARHQQFFFLGIQQFVLLRIILFLVGKKIYLTIINKCFIPRKLSILEEYYFIEKGEISRPLPAAGYGFGRAPTAAPPALLQKPHQTRMPVKRFCRASWESPSRLQRRIGWADGERKKPTLWLLQLRLHPHTEPSALRIIKMTVSSVITKVRLRKRKHKLQSHEGVH